MGDHFACTLDTLAECQLANCGGTSIEITISTASFYNLKDRGDVLTIPVAYYHDVSALREFCADAESLLIDILESGRRVFGSLARGPPRHQCVHLPGDLSVAWLHVHTFNELHGSPSANGEFEVAYDDVSQLGRSLQVCIEGGTPTADAAAQILRSADICMASARLMPSPTLDNP